jgi:hypothetical protein
MCTAFPCIEKLNRHGLARDFRQDATLQSPSERESPFPFPRRSSLLPFRRTDLSRTQLASQTTFSREEVQGTF